MKHYKLRVNSLTSLLIILMLVFGLSGCSRDQTIDQEDYLAIQVEMQEQFDFIEDSRIYFTGGPDVLTVVYRVEEGYDDFEACYEATKAFLLTEGTLDLLEMESMQYYPIKTINIDFVCDSYQCRYCAEYYKGGPEGYQDNRYWTEDNADHFETWVNSMTEFSNEDRNN